jgi:rare lipoprotein A (peptidoglycan hydrolase)
MEGTEGTRKYLAQHRTIKVGSIVKIRNESTNKEVFVRVTGNIPSGADEKVIIKISKSAFDRLGGTDATLTAEVTYYK